MSFKIFIHCFTVNERKRSYKLMVELHATVFLNVMVFYNLSTFINSHTVLTCQV